MTKIIVVETHNTDRPESAWKRGAVRVPDGDRLLQRVGSKNVAEYIIKSSTVGADGKRSFVLEDTEKWFADDLRSLLATGHLHSNVSWFDVDL
jgi:hypothetical protein